MWKLFALSLLTITLTAGHPYAGEITTPQQTKQPSQSDAFTKVFDFGTVSFDDNQQFNSLKVSVIKLDPTTIRVVTTFVVSGNKGAGISDGTPVAIQLQHDTAVMGITSGIGWAGTCHQDTTFTNEEIMKNIPFDAIDQVTMPGLIANDSAC